jgi:hypothetical protein
MVPIIAEAKHKLGKQKAEMSRTSNVELRTLNFEPGELASIRIQSRFQSARVRDKSTALNVAGRFFSFTAKPVAVDGWQLRHALQYLEIL